MIERKRWLIAGWVFLFKKEETYKLKKGGSEVGRLHSESGRCSRETVDVTQILDTTLLAGVLCRKTIWLESKRGEMR
ncbi:hypothetical protein VIGAN_10110600 [Vigna angularis var. angularis]|nr:hypothetical protein VIGAN_10110600 [Vigna angularis var. angularis]